MRKIFFLIYLVLVLAGFTENVFGQEFYKWVDEKGTVHFSDNPTYARNEQQKETSKENGIEVLKRSELTSRPTTDPSGKRIIINYSQGGSGGSSGGGGGSRRVSSGGS